MTIPVVNNHRENVAIGVCAGLLNALKLVGKKPETVKVVVNSAGAAGMGTAELLGALGFKRVIVCDRNGAIYKYRPFDMNWAKWKVAKITNLDSEKGTLEEVLRGADVFIGFANNTTLKPETIARMAKKPIVFAFGGQGPHQPETTPAEAKAAGAAVVSTALSTYPNQMELASVFPGVFRGLLDVRAQNFSIEMAIAAVHALAGVVGADLNADYIIPKVLDFRTAPAVAAAVVRAALKHGQALVEADRTVAERVGVTSTRAGCRSGARQENGNKSLGQQSVELHERYQGVLEIKNKIPVRDDYNLNLFYLVPGAIEPVRAIMDSPDGTFKLTARGNLVAIVSDGSAVLDWAI
jgi:malate dehydrogenase (oxaloacetate-decarboxylating)